MDSNELNSKETQIKKESALHIEDLNNGKYLITHNFFNQGVFYIEIFLWGREISISPIFLFMGFDGGVFLRPSENSVTEIISAELETGNFSRNPDIINKNKISLINLINKECINIIKKDIKKKKEYLDAKINSESMRIENELETNKEFEKKILSYKKYADHYQAEFDTIEILENLEKEFKEFKKMKKEVFIENFKEIISNGFVFQTVPATRLFSPQNLKIKIDGFKTGFMKIHLNDEVKNFNKTTSKIEYEDKLKYIIINIDGKVYKVKATSQTIEDYMFKGLAVLSTI